MTHKTKRSLCAATAISAVLALGSTPVLAQDASAPLNSTQSITSQATPEATRDTATAPQSPLATPSTTTPANPVVIDTPPPAASNAPAVVMPAAPTIAPMAQVPLDTTTTASRPAPAERAPARETASRTRTPVHNAAASTQTAKAAPEPARTAPLPPIVPSADVAPPAAAPAQPAAAPAPVATAQPVSSDTGLLFGTLAAILALSGLGFAAFYGLRRRRPLAEEDAYEGYAEPVVDEPLYAEPVAAEPFMAQPVMVEPETTEPVMAETAMAEPMVADADTTEKELAYEDARPVAAEAVPVEQPMESPRFATPLTAGPVVYGNGFTRPATLNQHAKGFVMPSGPVPTGEARQKLIKQMVAAPPDEENPFTTAKGRTRRAKLILQRREQELRDEATQPFDYRTYRPTGANRPASAVPAPESV